MIAGSSPGPPPATAAWQHNAHGYAYTNAPAQHSAVPAQHVPVAREALLTDARIAGSSQLNANDERNHRPMNQVWQLYLSWKIASSPWYDRPFKVFSCDALSIHVILPADRHEQTPVRPRTSRRLALIFIASMYTLGKAAWRRSARCRHEGRRRTCSACVVHMAGWLGFALFAQPVDATMPAFSVSLTS